MTGLLLHAQRGDLLRDTHLARWLKINVSQRAVRRQRQEVGGPHELGGPLISFDELDGYSGRFATSDT